MQEYMNYEEYHLSMKEETFCLGTAAILTGIAAWILYKSFWGFLLILIFFPLCRKGYIEEKKEKRKQILLLEFKETMQSVAASLLSGYSIENAWKEAEKELQELYGKDGLMQEEMKRMNSAIYKWYILPPAPIVDSCSINKAQYNQPIVSNLNY